MTGRDGVYQLLGLARRAGAVVPGTAAVRDAIRAGDARLVLLAGDAAPGQLDKIRRTPGAQRVLQVSIGDRAQLGAAVGLAPLAAVALTDERLAQRVRVELDAGDGIGAVSPLDGADVAVAHGAIAGEA